MQIEYPMLRVCTLRPDVAAPETIGRLLRRVHPLPVILRSPYIVGMYRRENTTVSKDRRSDVATSQAGALGHRHAGRASGLENTVGAGQSARESGTDA
jgi:hypothetical protein